MREPVPHTFGHPDRASALEGRPPLAPLRLGHLSPGTVLEFDLFLPAVELSGGVHLAWPQGQVFPGNAREWGWGYFPFPQTGAVLNYLWSRVEAQPPPEGGTLELLADTLLVWVQHFYGHEAARNQESLNMARGLIRRLQHLWKGIKRPLPALETLRRHDSGLFSHCLNVGLLGLAFFPHLPGEGAAEENFVLGALLHDLGMMTQGPEVFQLTGPLSDADWEKIKGHPELGAALLQSLGELPEPVLLMVRQHHESLDGSGYPAGLAGEAIHPWARLLRILDSYEAITSLRPWRPPLHRRQALHIMASAWSSQGGYDRHYLSLFLAFCQE